MEVVANVAAAKVEANVKVEAVANVAVAKVEAANVAVVGAEAVIVPQQPAPQVPAVRKVAQIAPATASQII